MQSRKSAIKALFRSSPNKRLVDNVLQHLVLIDVVSINIVHCLSCGTLLAELMNEQRYA